MWLSSLPFLCPFTGTSNVLSLSKSSSFTVTVIGPSTFSPGVTVIFPSSPISTGTVFPSSSLASTVVGVLSSLLITVKPVSCFVPSGFTVSGVPVTSVFFSSGVGVVAVAVAVIVALLAVIGVPAGVDHTGFSYPSVAVTAGYLSAVNAVPSFTS